MTVLWISFFLVITLFLFASFWLWKLKDFKLYNFFIFIILVFVWFSERFIASNIEFYGLGSWTLPIALALFYFVQVVTRVPLGILSNKINSRTAILKLVICLWILVLVLTISFYQQWNIWILTISAGLIASTYGLQNQYNVENYNIKNVFQSIGIVYITPVLGGLLAFFISNLFKNLEVNHRLLWVFVLGISLLTLALLFIIKERKSTIKLDSHITKKYKYNFKKKELLILCFNIFLISISSNLIKDTSTTTHYGIDTPIYLHLILKAILFFVGIFTGAFLIKKMKIYYVKIIGYTFISLGLLAFSVLLLLDNKSEPIYLISISLLSIGYAILFLTLFGAALHADVKNPVLISGIFLSVTSLAFTITEFTSNTLLLNISSAHLSNSILLYSSVVFLLMAIAFSTITYKKNKAIYKTPRQYEFNINS